MKDSIKQAKIIIDSISAMIQSSLSKAKFNTKKRATIQALNVDGTANITMNGITYNNVKIRTGLLPQVNEVVWIEIPNNNFNDAYIDTANAVSGTGQSIDPNSHTHPNKSLLDTYTQIETNLADAVSKKHEHNNLSLLQTITQTLINTWNTVTNKVDKVSGKQLSTEDYTTLEKNKLSSIESNANNYIHPSTHSPSIISQDSNNRFVSDTEKNTWNAKQNALGFTPENIINKGIANGYAELDETGKVPSSQLPSYVDDVLEYANLVGFPSTGETGKIYVALDTNKTYRWSGTTYIEISESLALGETSSTAYRGDYGSIAYNHSQVAHAPSNAQKNSDITKSEVEAKLTGEITSHSHANDHSHSNKTALDLVTGTNTGNETTTTIGTLINNATTKTTPVNNDMVGLMDSGASNVLKKLSWANIKATLKTYFDSLYSLVGHNHNLINLSEKNYSSLDGKPLDDNFHNLSFLLESANDDELLIYDTSASTYNKITKVNLLAGLGNSSTYVFVKYIEEHIAHEGQTVFNLTKGTYQPNTDRMSIYLTTGRISPIAYSESSSTSVTMLAGLSENERVIFDYISIINTMDFIHASNHTIGGIDPLSPADIGASKIDHQHTKIEISDFSHNHNIIDIGGLQNELDGKANASQVLTNVPAGALFTDTIYNHPSTHSADMIVDGTTNKVYTATEKTKLADISSGAEVNQNAFSNVKIGTTTVSADSKTDTLEIVAGTGITLTPDATNDKITINGVNQYVHPNHTGDVTSSGDGVTSISNSVVTNAKLSTVSTGIIKGRMSVGSGVVEDLTTIQVRSLLNVDDGANNYVHPDAHLISETTGLQTALDGKVDNSKVLTNVPVNAKFTDTITTINGKTGAISKADIVALGIPTQDTVYAHPVTHPPSIIQQDINNRFVSDSEKGVWNGKQDALGFTPVNTTDNRLSDARTPLTHTHAEGEITNLVTDLAGKEPVITKLSAFNKNYGTTATDVKINGVQSVGNVDAIARIDHVHPVDTSRAATSHTHTKSNITDFPIIPTDTNQLAKTDVYTKVEVDNKIASAGGGDMTKAIYDANGDGKVNSADVADKLSVVRNINSVAFDGSSDITIEDSTKVNKSGDTMLGKLTLPLGTTAEASINIPHGSAPTSPVNGDIWTTTSAPMARINGTTRTIYHNGNASTAALTTVTQAEAEAGTSTTVRAWTPQRVKQAIDKFSPIFVGTTAPSNTTKIWIDTN